MPRDTRKALEAMCHTLVSAGSSGELIGIQTNTQYKIMIGASNSSSPDGTVVGY